jgi:hypothetical protein
MIRNTLGRHSHWKKVAEALFSDNASSPAGKKRGFCQLLLNNLNVSMTLTGPSFLLESSAGAGCLLAIFLLIVLSAFFAGTEAALANINRHRSNRTGSPAPSSCARPSPTSARHR